MMVVTALTGLGRTSVVVSFSDTISGVMCDIVVRKGWISGGICPKGESSGGHRGVPGEVSEWFLNGK